MELTDVLDGVNVSFVRRGAALGEWADPHPDRQPPAEAYSRLTNPARWRILGARADAWAAVLVELGVARPEVVDKLKLMWPRGQGPVTSSAVRLRPVKPGALPLVVARSWLGDLDDAGVTLGVGEPAVGLDFFPDCGCDACDSGSHDELDRLDRTIAGVVTGQFRLLTRGAATITAGFAGALEASSNGPGPGLGRRQVAAALANPTGWTELSGPSWF